MKESFENMKCVWMLSGQIDYKLCDENFDCDNCSFDRIMRNLDVGKEQLFPDDEQIKDQNIIYSLFKKLRNKNYIERHILLENNVVLKRLFENTYYLGLNRIAEVLLDNFAGCKFCKSQNGIRAGDPLLKIWGEWGEFRIKSPLNINYLGKINSTSGQIFIHKWLGLIEAGPKDVEKSKISEDRYQEKITELKRALIKHTNITATVGETMQDGGKKIDYIYQLFGKERYVELLNRFFTG